MNPLIFYGFKVDEDPQDFIGEVYNILFSMGFSKNQKAQLTTFQLKDVAQTFYVQLRNDRPLRGGPVTLQILKKEFLDQFFARETRESKVVKFINLRQGGKNVHDYSLKFSKQSKYAPSLVSDPRDEMSHFVTRVVDDLQEKSHSVMLHDNFILPVL